jgi:cell division protein FtsB
MSNATAHTAPARPGDTESKDLRRSRFSARRRLLILSCLVLLVAVAVAANYGALRHYQDARARLEKTTAEVAALEQQKAALQSQLGKLGEAGHLEGLARQELTYVRPGEELYIVTGPASDDSATANAAATSGSEKDDTGEAGRVPGCGIGASVPGAESAASVGVGAAAPGPEPADAGGTARPGLLERLVSAIANIF